MESPDAQVPNTIKQWITLGVGWEGFSIAYHLQEEGKESIIGQVQNKDEIKYDAKEKPDERENRLKNYEGMIKKYPAAKLVKALKKVKNKDEYFIFCDHNQMWPYAEELLKAGFKNGLFPTKKDFDFEKGREEAMDFVQEHYPDIQIIPHQKVSTVEEAREIVENTEVPLVIQSEGDYVPTIVGPDDVEQSKVVLLSVLQKYEKDYAKGEIILKEKLVRPVEITPQMVFWNGEPVFTDVDIETKNIGDGENNGGQVGCGNSLIIRTKFEDEINRIAFPPVVYEMAKEHTGMFYWDISIYLTENGLFFGEFCSNRPGYDAIMTEMTMAHGPAMYFEKIMAGENPLDFTFGTSVRVFNLKLFKEHDISVGSWKPTWLYDVQMKDGQMVSVGGDWDFGVITGRGESIDEAVNNVYRNYNTLVFKEKYARTKEDFLSDYPTSIIRRFNEVNHKYFDVLDLLKEPGETEENVSSMAKQIKEMEEKIRTGMDSVTELTQAIKDMPKIKKTLAQKIKEKLHGKS